MGDQIVAPRSSLKDRIAQKPTRSFILLWNFVRYWARYLLFGGRKSIPALVDFVLEDHLCSSMQKPDELTALCEMLAARRPEHLLEIGTAHGGTLFVLTRLASPHATIISVDLTGGRLGEGPTRALIFKRFARRRQRLYLLLGDSHSAETLNRVKDILKQQALDFLFIDGDHSYEGVKRDFELYGPLVRKGGIVAFHDIVDGAPEFVGGVPAFWREIRPRYRHAEIIENPRQGGWGIGVLYID
jgi:predicted O-methyltransferase YrrM